MSNKPTTLNDCRQLIKERTPFSFNHVFADLEDGFTTGRSNKPPIYKIYSYSRDNPILVFDFGREKWIGLKDAPNDKISQLHMSLVDNDVISHWVSHEDLVHISINGLSGDITNPKYSADRFVKVKSKAELLAEYVAIHGPIYDHPAPGRVIEKITIQNPVWYYNAVGMLAHNYATISEASNGNGIIYFFYDDGRYGGHLPRYISRESAIESFSGQCVIDSISLVSTVAAKEMLALNGFEPITPEADKRFMGHLSKHHPKGEIFFEISEFTDRPYSQGRRWNWWDDPDHGFP